MTSQSSMLSGQQNGQGQGQDNFNNGAGNGYTNRVTYGMTSSVGALGVQPHRSLTSMTSNGAGKGQGLGGGGGGGGGGFNGMGAGKMALSGRQMMLLKEDSHGSNNGSHGGPGQGQGQGQGPGPGLDPMGESQEYGGGNLAHQEGLNYPGGQGGQEGTVTAIGGAFSSSRGGSPNHQHPSQQSLRGQPTHPRFQGTRYLLLFPVSYFP